MKSNSFKYNFLDLKLEGKTNDPQETVSVAQYNILAGNLGEKKHFPYVKEEYLDWKYRRELIVQQINQIFRDKLPDFLCFEEFNDFWTFFQKKFRSIGLEGVYAKRPSTHSSSWSGLEKRRKKNRNYFFFFIKKEDSNMMDVRYSTTNQNGN